MEMRTLISGLLIPFIGTAAGAGCVFFLRRELSVSLQRALTGFAAGVMVAASIWSLIVPAIEQSAQMGRWAFLPAFLGFWLGILFLLLLDHVIPHLHRSIDQAEGPESHLTRRAMLVLAVTLHNIPEGMAVGVVYAGLRSGYGEITAGGALALALGIAIQNFPEGAIISMPLCAEGASRQKSFWLGVLSGAVEPIFGALTILAAAQIVPAMPMLLSFAAMSSAENQPLVAFAFSRATIASNCACVKVRSSAPLAPACWVLVLSSAIVTSMFKRPVGHIPF